MRVVRLAHKCGGVGISLLPTASGFVIHPVRLLVTILRMSRLHDMSNYDLFDIIVIVHTKVHLFFTCSTI